MTIKVDQIVATCTGRDSDVIDITSELQAVITSTQVNGVCLGT